MRWPQFFIVLVGMVLVCAMNHCRAADTRVILDETGYFRHYNRFGVNRYCPGALKTEGEEVLSKKGVERLQRDTERFLQGKGQDLSKVDWTEHVFQPMFANFAPTPAGPPPQEWTAVSFDDSGWVLRRRPFQGTTSRDITRANLGQFDESMDLGLLHSYYRAGIIIDDPARAGLTFAATYHGGLRVLVNGQEIARGHLPTGELDANVCGEGYSREAYAADGAKLRDRLIGPVSIPAQLLRKGVNVLALEVHASDFHPVVLTNERQPNWGGPTRPWPHAQLCRLEVRSLSSAVKSVTTRPGGMQVWVADVNRQLASDDFLPAGEDAGTIRVVGARNGTYSAQMVVGADKALADLVVTPGPLKLATGPETLPASVITVLYPLPFPQRQWTLRYLGDERGLNSSFPDNKILETFGGMETEGGPWVFDQITSQSPAVVPSNTSRPIWLSLTIPAGTLAGEYRGTVKVAAKGLAPVEVPVELRVVDWVLPSPKEFRTLVGCEENPYGVAKQYGVSLWSDEHFRLIATSMAQLARIGNRWVNVPVLVNTEYGNQEDSMIHWIRRKDGTWAFDYAILDRYLDLVVRHCGPPRVINVVVMHGTKGVADPPKPGQIKYLDEATGKTALLDMHCTANAPGSVVAWQAFAQSFLAHMQGRGLDKAVFWGHPLEGEADPQLQKVLAEVTPDVFWIAGPHEMMSNGTYAKNEEVYKLVETIRYWGNWPTFRMDQGWRSPRVHLLNPRVGGTVFGMHTTSLPFAYRVMPDHALAFGRNGFTRVGADEWAGIHYEGCVIGKWETGIPVLFVLWPGKDGAESSVRFEALVEGLQETEARIFVEQAIERGELEAGLAAKVKKVLSDNLQETMFFQGNSMIRAFEEYSFGWQTRSARLYEAAAEVQQQRTARAR